MIERKTEDYDVLDLWTNLTPSIRAVSASAVITYLGTLFAAIALNGVIPLYATALLVLWPAISVVWLLLLWILLAAGSISVPLAGGKLTGNEAKAQYSDKIVKAVIFLPVVVGSILAVADVFASDIFSE
jgi:hypothetical protein